MSQLPSPTATLSEPPRGHGSGASDEDILAYLHRECALFGDSRFASSLTPNEALQQLLPEASRRLLQPATRLELLNAVASLERRDDEHTDDLKDRLTRETRTLPTLYGIVVGAISLVVAGMTWFGAMKYLDLVKIEAASRELQASLAGQKESLEGITEVARSLVTFLPMEELLASTEESMNSITLSLGSQVVFERARRVAACLDRVLKHSGTLPEDAVVVLHFARDLNTQVAGLSAIHAQPAVDDVGAVRQKWEALTVPPSLLDGPHRDFALRTSSYRRNIVGVLKMLQYSRGGRTDPALLQSARGDFEAAMRDAPQSVRPRSNLAVLQKWEIERSEPLALEALKPRMLALVRAYEAAHPLADAAGQGTLCNNIASSLVLLADRTLKDSPSDTRDVLRLLARADDSIREARSKIGISGTVYITWAEAESVRVGATAASILGLTEDARREEFDRILGLVGRGVAMGFVGYKHHTPDTFAAKETYFRHLAALEPEYMQPLLKAAGIEP